VSLLDAVRDELRADGSVRGRRVAVLLPLGAPLTSALTAAGAHVTATGAEVVVADGRVGLSRPGSPAIAVRDGRWAGLLDDAAGRSTVLAIADATNLLLSGKRLAVVGYDPVGRSVARHARGMNAQVTVCEVEPLAALEAHRDGFDLLPIEDAVAVTDVVVSASELPAAAIGRLRDGTLLTAVSLPAREAHRVRERVDEVTLDGGRSVFVVHPGRQLPAELVELSLVAHALAARHLLLHGAALEPGLHPLPLELDEEIARRQLDELGLR
jgi:adenosylhomocysteinase